MKVSSAVFLALIFPFLSSSQIIFVDNLATGLNDGTSWGNAYNDLKSAMENAVPGNEIWVAKGTYFPTEGTDRKIFFEVPKGVAVYGGFSGSEILLEERNFEENETILSGDIGVVGDSADNSFTVVFMAFPDTNTILDGFTVFGGNANSENIFEVFDSPTKRGGGIYVQGKSSSDKVAGKIRNCTISNNSSTSHGGGIFYNAFGGGRVVLMIKNCTFYQNAAPWGAAIAFEGGSLAIDPRHLISNCTFDSNYAGFPIIGGMILLNITTPGSGFFTFSGCKFICNRGAIKIETGANDFYCFQITNCSFEKNETTIIYGLGNFSEPNLNMEINNCTFTENQERTCYLSNTDTASFTNCKFQNNIGTPIVSGGSNLTKLKHCVFMGNSTFSDAGAVKLGGSSIYITSTIFGNNKSNSAAGAISVSAQKAFLLNNFLFNNSSSNNLGVVAIRNASGDYKIINCTFFNNSQDAGVEVAVIFFAFNPVGQITIQNSILWTEGNDYLISTENANMEIQNSLLARENCTSAVEIIPEFIYDGNGNIADSLFLGTITCEEGILFDLDPLFADTAANDLSLQACSPAINAGNNTIIADLGIGSDLIGSPRILDGIVDLGAFESLNLQVDVVEVQPVNCAGSGDGFVIIEIPNGCAPFFYEWENDTSSGTGTEGLSAGSYQFTITDALGKQAVAAVEITEPPPLSLIPSVQPADCETGTGGSAAVHPNGGTAPFQYLWDNQATDSILTNIPAGNYSVTVTDANGCTATSAVEVTSTGDLLLSISIHPISCHDSNDGTATVTPLTGLPPFQFLWMDGQTDSLLTGIGSGDYSVTVTDANGCSDFLSFNIQAPQVLNLAISANDISCPGEQDGTATVTVSGGTSPYGYIWSNFQTAETAVNLSPGEYWVTVTDVSNCSDSIVVEVGEPDSIGIDFEVQNANNSNPADGAITLFAVFGGAPPFSFLWNTGDTTQSLSNLPAGDYSVTVEDAAACQRHFAFTVDIETAVQESDLAHLEALISPNPAKRNESARLLFNSSKSLLLEMKLFDSGGKLVRQKLIFVNKGSTDVPISAPFISGLYFVQLSVEDGGRNYLKWVVVQ